MFPKGLEIYWRFNVVELLPMLFVIGLFTMLNWPKGKEKKKDPEKDFANAVKDYLKEGFIIRTKGGQ